MSKNQFQKSLSDRVLGVIESGDIDMKPQWYFMLKFFMSVVSTVLMIVFCAFLLSFAIFIMNANGSLILSQFGLNGVLTLLASLPWVLLFLCAVLILGSEIACKSFSAVYQKPLIYSLTLLIAFLGIGTFALHANAVHEHAYTRLRSEEGSPLGRLYHWYATMKPKDVFFGKAVNVENDTFDLLTSEHQVMKVYMRTNTRLVPPNHRIVPNDPILCYCEQAKQNALKARGIKVFQNQALPVFWSGE
ncbi:MAG: hypothetical protein HY453_01655 [Parcubacteria group bacterium]|nr:hypothetical protein [Parcubacteria group bacterium]